MRYDHYEVLLDPAGQPLCLGQGGMGVTYRARDLTLGREVALKVVHPHLMADPNVRMRFLREARATAQLHHRNIATIHHQGQTGETCYYAMEFIRGETLQQVLQRGGPLPVARALAITRQVVQALAEAETHGLVHRDIKPANIMLVTEADGHELVKLIDFGLAKFVQAQEVPGEELSRPGGYLGTATTSSPEQCRGEELDTRSDFYSLGVTLWQMLDGRPPFEDPNTVKVLLAHLGEKPPFERLDRFPRPLRRMIRQLLEKDRDRRPATTAELMRMLDECRGQPGMGGAAGGDTGGLPDDAGPGTLHTGREDPTLRLTSRVRRPAYLAGTVALLALAGGLGYLFWPRSLPGPVPTPTPVPPVIPVAPPTPPEPALSGPELHARALSLLAAGDRDGFLQAHQAWHASAGGSGPEAKALNEAFQRSAESTAEAWLEWARSSPDDLARLRAAAGLGLEEAWLLLAESSLISDPVQALDAFQRAARAIPRVAAEACLGALLTARGRPEFPEATRAWQEQLDELKRGDEAVRAAWVARLAPRLEQAAPLHAPTLDFLASGPPGLDPARQRHWARERTQVAERGRDWPTAVAGARALWKEAPESPEGAWALARLNQWFNQWTQAGVPEGLGSADAVRTLATACAGEGVPAAMEWLAKQLLKEDPTAARNWFEKAARSGSGTAAAQLGLMLLRGQGGAEDPDQAGEWLRQARDRQSDIGAYVLADALLLGAMPEATPGEALSALRQAAGMGMARAMDRLGDCYRRGQGVAVDHAQALAWFEDAIEAGYWQALGNKGVMHMLGEGGPPDKALAVSLFQQGADKGNARCMYLLGQAYWGGQGIAPDRAQAAEWMRRAAAAGSSEAKAWLEENP